MKVEEILIKPLLSEKVSKMTDSWNYYSFVVNRKANKNQIKEAVEKFFDVKVKKVNTCIMHGKYKRVGKHLAKVSNFKKAFVQVADGQKIEFFKNV